MKLKSSSRKERRVLLYGDVNLNILDGSAVWLVSMAEALSRTETHVTVLLKTRVHNERLIERILGIPNIALIYPSNDQHEDKELTPREAAQKVVSLDRLHSFDHIIVRGLKVCTFVGKSEAVGHKSWLYVTDLPDPGSEALSSLRNAAARCRRVFAQTEDARSYMEAAVPEAAGKTLVLTPMIPDSFFGISQSEPKFSGELSLVYSGKFAKNWRTLEMCSLPALLASAGIPATLTMIGDKFQTDPKDPIWSTLMREAISAPGVRWLGGLSRDEAVAEVSRHDIGLSWRDEAMNSSLEISTKVLEFAAAGVPPLVNRNAAHERLLGSDYPLFIEGDSAERIIDVLKSATTKLPSVRERTTERVQEYSMSASSRRLEKYFLRAEADYGEHPLSSRKKRVVLAGHDFKFAGELVDSLQSRDDIDLRFDHWESLHKHSLKQSQELLEWADIIICEWCGPNAVWYSTNKKHKQTLIVRLHMFELRGPWMENIDDSAIDVLVCVSALYQDRIRESTGWTDTDICVIPNAVDLNDLSRPKDLDSKFRLGLVGIVPYRKRPDRALDVLEKLLEQDQRYSLHIRGRMPWEYSYEWDKPLQREAYLNFFSRIGASPQLRDAVVFEPFGADMGNWLRKIGYVLSPSSDESFHLAPAEGMASGCLPVIWDRPGARGIFGNEWIFNDSTSAADFIRQTGLDDELLIAQKKSAQDYVGRFDRRVVEGQWLGLLGLGHSK